MSPVLLMECCDNGSDCSVECGFLQLIPIQTSVSQLSTRTFSFNTKLHCQLLYICSQRYNVFESGAVCNWSLIV